MALKNTHRLGQHLTVVSHIDSQDGSTIGSLQPLDVANDDGFDSHSDVGALAMAQKGGAIDVGPHAPKSSANFDDMLDMVKSLLDQQQKQAARDPSHGTQVATGAGSAITALLVG